MFLPPPWDTKGPRIGIQTSKKTVVLWIFHQNTTMPRHLRTVSFYFLSVAVLVAALAAGRAIAGEPGAAPDTYDMTAANWLMMLPLVLVLAAAFGMNFRERRLIIRHRVTVAHPDLDHSNRRYPRAASAPLSAILPPPALATSIPCSMAWSPPTSVRPAAPTAVHCAGCPASLEACVCSRTCRRF